MVKRLVFTVGLVCCYLLLFSCTSKTPDKIQQKDEIMSSESKLDTAVFGAGCFWCVETTFQMLAGVEKVESGYMGGFNANPTYKEVCSGQSGHAEVVRVIYNADIISFQTLLEAFWAVHNPTTLNQQGADKGTQYRSVIFYTNEAQKLLSEKDVKALNSSGVWENPVVTEISAASEFYVAENYHQDYFNLNGEQPYCRFVIEPKVEKFKKVFKLKIK